MKNKNTTQSFKGNRIYILNIILICVIIFLLFIIFLYHVNIYKYNKKSIITHDQSVSYKYTNPILDCELNSLESNDLAVSNDDISNKVKEVKDKYKLDSISLYFRDLNDGPWVGIGENEVFSPASLLKVPILIELLHESESNPALLDKIIDISPSDINQNISQNIKPENPLKVGVKYSLLEVARSMIEESDNTAVIAILQNINRKAVGDVFKAVGVPFEDTTKEVNVKVKDYAGFFRILFNSSYLDRDMSEKALEILSKSEYNDGIVAGVPKDIIVSHKFGERNIDGEKDTNQLHDCGIVYYPNEPYIICIMTKGNNFKSQGESIQELSSYIYNKVDKQKKS